MFRDNSEEAKREQEANKEKRSRKTAEDSYRQLSRGMKDRNVPFPWAAQFGSPVGKYLWSSARL
jgi:hypothetical protein